MRQCVSVSIVYLVAGFCLVFASPSSSQVYQPPGSSRDNPTFGERRPWDLSVRAFLGRNDNVPLVPDSTDFYSEDPAAQKSNYAGLTIDGNYRWLQTNDYLAGAGLHFDKIHYDKNLGSPCCTSDPRDYNLTAVSPTIFGRYFFGLANGMPASVGMAYSYSKDWLAFTRAGREWFTKIHSIDLDFETDINRQLNLAVTYNHSSYDFNPVQAANTRDGTAQTLGLVGTYNIQGGLRSIVLGYQYGVYDADGRNWDITDSHAVNAGFKTHLHGPVWANLDVSYTWEDYRGFSAVGIPAPGRKRQRIGDYGLSILYLLTQQVTLDFYYRHTDWSSNQQTFEADRDNFGIGATYRF